MDYYKQGFLINTAYTHFEDGHAFAGRGCEHFGEMPGPLDDGGMWSRGGMPGVFGQWASAAVSSAPGRLPSAQLLNCSASTVKGQGRKPFELHRSEGSSGTEIQESIKFTGLISWTLTLGRRGCGKK